jgi:hypothetical protein
LVANPNPAKALKFVVWVMAMASQIAQNSRNLPATPDTPNPVDSPGHGQWDFPGVTGDEDIGNIAG